MKITQKTVPIVVCRGDFTQKVVPKIYNNIRMLYFYAENSAKATERIEFTHGEVPKLT